MENIAKFLLADFAVFKPLMCRLIAAYKNSQLRSKFD